VFNLPIDSESRVV